jgi:small subunit ribosomal protein S6e
MEHKHTHTHVLQEDDVRKYVNTYRREFETKNGKKHSKAPKIQRLVTPEVCRCLNGRGGV